MSKTNCWDIPCSMGFKICCFECEAFQGCPESCDWVEECRGEEDEK